MNAARAAGGISGIEVRPMRAADLKRVLEIENVAYSTPWTLPTFRGLLDRGDVDLLVAEAFGGVIGYAVCWSAMDQAELGNLAVAPEWRRRGVAALLLERTLERQVARGMRQVFLEVRESNRPAQRLYHRFGFREVGRRPRYYSMPEEDALVMCLRLDRRRDDGERSSPPLDEDAPDGKLS